MSPARSDDVAPAAPVIRVNINTLLQVLISLLLTGLAWNMQQLNSRLTLLEQMRDRLTAVENEVKAARNERMQQLSNMEVSIMRLEKSVDRLTGQLETHTLPRK